MLGGDADDGFDTVMCAEFFDEGCHFDGFWPGAEYAEDFYHTLSIAWMRRA